jgi:hypothetical protein
MRSMVEGASRRRLVTFIETLAAVRKPGSARLQ